MEARYLIAAVTQTDPSYLPGGALMCTPNLIRGSVFIGSAVLGVTNRHKTYRDSPRYQDICSNRPHLVSAASLRCLKIVRRSHHVGLLWHPFPIAVWPSIGPTNCAKICTKLYKIIFQMIQFCLRLRPENL